MPNGYRPGPPFEPNSPYGYRTDPYTGVPGKFHAGQDYRAPAGAPIPTAASGVVVYSGFNDKFGMATP
jgi:murein DD-endopeptidase MepM/ murein hydrolase activator NlpD